LLIRGLILCSEALGRSAHAQKAKSLVCRLLDRPALVDEQDRLGIDALGHLVLGVALESLRDLSLLAFLRLVSSMRDLSHLEYIFSN
jgi:hypothetical protein